MKPASLRKRDAKKRVKKQAKNLKITNTKCM